MKEEIGFRFPILLTISFVICASFGSPASNEEKKWFIKLNPNEPAKWVTESEMMNLLRQVGFLDLTHIGKDVVLPKSRVGKNSEPYPISPKEKKTVSQVLKNVNMKRVEQFVTDVSNFYSRNYRSYYGPGSANEWLLSEVQSLVNLFPKRVTTEVITSDRYQQKNIIAKLMGSDATLKSEIVILGAHLDSINHVGEKERAPGADDNGSGSGLILEVLKAILETGTILKRSIEFHWYAAEEIGIMGSDTSDTVSETYRNESRNVIGMLNLDCLGYVSEEGKVIAIYTDYSVDKDLTEFVRMIANNYVTYNWANRRCTTYCSDHNRWNSQGYPAAYVSERITTKYIHSKKDAIETINFEQVNEFAKLAVGFVVELGASASS